MARKEKKDQSEIGPRERLERDKAMAHKEAAQLQRNYYNEHNMLHYVMTDAQGKLLTDENDPLFARLEAGLR